MSRFFVEPQDIGENTAKIEGGDVKHISRVLRMEIGDEVTLCDGEGNDYAAKISSITKDEVLLDVLSKSRCKAEPDCRITLYQGLPKAGKMETIVQKCVELGITQVVPVAAERSVVKIKAGEFENKRTRYQRVAEEAAKQCGRGIIPQVGELTTYKKADLSQHDLVVVAYEEEKELSLKNLLRNNPDAKNIALIIGPEGGLDKSEVEALCAKGGKPVTLGSRILRTETAGMATLAMILYELEG